MSATILPFSIPKSDAMMSVHSTVPKSAMTASLLGTERHSHAVQISEDGLMLTVGYSVMEADKIWLSNRSGQSVEAVVLAHDYDSGIALLRPFQPLGKIYIEAAPTCKNLKAGDKLSILTSKSRKGSPVELFAKEEYAGRWEYLLEEALYTTPLCDNWSGAALLNTEGKLCGIGSLALSMKNLDGKVQPGNLFIPTDLVMPHIEEMKTHGQKPGQIRPWLGTLVDELESELHVVGLYVGGPAAEAGIRPGDIILSVNNQPVSTMADFFRMVWLFGPAGSKVPLTLRNRRGVREVVLDTIDRDSFFIQHSTTYIS